MIQLQQQNTTTYNQQKHDTPLKDTIHSSTTKDFISFFFPSLLLKRKEAVNSTISESFGTGKQTRWSKRCSLSAGLLPHVLIFWHSVSLNSIEKQNCLAPVRLLLHFSLKSAINNAKVVCGGTQCYDEFRTPPGTRDIGPHNSTHPCSPSIRFYSSSPRDVVECCEWPWPVQLIDGFEKSGRNRTWRGLECTTFPNQIVIWPVAFIRHGLLLFRGLSTQDNNPTKRHFWASRWPFCVMKSTIPHLQSTTPFLWTVSPLSTPYWGLVLVLGVVDAFLRNHGNAFLHVLLYWVTAQTKVGDTTLGNQAIQIQ